MTPANPVMSNSADGLERALVEEGQLDSVGGFTLDVKLALRKLNERLLQPEDSLLYLVQSAVASGANWIEVESTQGELVLEHDGFFPEREQLSQILSWALSSGSERQAVPQHRLGLALAASLAPPGTGMRLEFSDGSAVWLRPGPAGGVEMREGKASSSVARGKIYLSLRPSWWRRWLGTSRCALKRLRERARFAPVLLRIQGEVVAGVEYGIPAHEASWGADESPENSDHHALEVRVPRQSSDCDWLALPVRQSASHLVAPNVRDFTHTIGTKTRFHEVCACSAALAWGTKRSARVEVVQYGVSLLPLNLKELPDRLWMLFADTTLATDATCLKPVMQDALRDRMGPLLEKFEEASKPYRERYRRLQTGIPFEVWLIDLVSLQKSEVD